MSYIIWTVLGYFTSKQVAKRNPQVSINPVLYAIGSFLFGYLGTMSYLGYKVSHSKDNPRGEVMAILGLVIAVIINIMVLI